MPYEKINTALTFQCGYIATKQGKTGLTVAATVYKPDGTKAVDAVAASAVGDGIYQYTLSSSHTAQIGEYVCVFKTADATVDQQHLFQRLSVGRAGVGYLDDPISDKLDASAYATGLASLTSAIDDLPNVAQIAAAASGGPGSTEYSDTVVDADDNPVSGAIVLIRTASNISLDPIHAPTTNDFGVWTTMLDPGNYYAWVYADGVDADNPYPFTVS